MKLTPIKGITLGKGQGKIQLQNQTSEPILSGTIHHINLQLGETKTGFSKLSSIKGLIAPVEKSKNDFSLMLTQSIEPNETIEMDFTLPITVKAEQVVNVTVETQATEKQETPAEQKDEVKEEVEETEKHPDSGYWWFGGDK